MLMRVQIFVFFPFLKISIPFIFILEKQVFVDYNDSNQFYAWIKEIFSTKGKNIDSHKYVPEGLLSDDNLMFPLKEREETIKELITVLQRHFSSNSQSRKDHPIP
jgi:hypothetical protein